MVFGGGYLAKVLLKSKHNCETSMRFYYDMGMQQSNTTVTKTLIFMCF